MQSYVLLFTLTLVGYSCGQTTAPQLPDVEDALAADGRFTTFLQLLKATDLLDQINETDHFTIFASTDAAFAKLPAGTLDNLKASPAQLDDVIGYHVVLNTSFRVHGTQQDTVLHSSTSQPIRINTYNVVHTVTAEGVNITVKNISVNHGYVHGIDGLMKPPLGNVVDLGSVRTDISTFESLLVQANLTTYFTSDHSTTTFIPNDDAFKKLTPDVLEYLNTHPADLAEVLRFHFVKQLSLYSLGMKHAFSIQSTDHNHDLLMLFEDDNGGMKVNHAKILEKDISSVNGVVHIIDSVLIPAKVLVAIEDSKVVIG
ncbi:hypothetical protein Btru_044631 [Bulinus truncatus]|nr:hypothetical protein Btru_044631 [Bulinus truncatus]